MAMQNSVFIAFQQQSDEKQKCVENLMSLIDIPQIGVLAYNINGKITFLEEKK